ncbi:hypothetical protein QJQ45_005382 [Haematococcus lacustris]|nr:hypothetical protein QJQ45_005382 [Haematococcus lacustris]
MEALPNPEQQQRGLRPLGVRMFPGNPFVSHIYIKEHRGAADIGAAIFVAGLPLGMTEDVLKQALSCFGALTHVVLHPARRSGMAVFEDPAARMTALKAAGHAQIIELTSAAQGLPTNNLQATGLRAWVEQHKAARPEPEELQRQLDEWTAAHEAEEERRAKERQAAMGGDGWTVVVRSKGRKKSKEDGGVATQSGGVALAAAQASAAATKALPVQDFYRFQQRDKRRSELLDLRDQFQQDKKRITELRAARNFKPVS